MLIDISAPARNDGRHAKEVANAIPGALYHVLDRGDRREAIFRDDADRSRFVETLGEACRRTGWRIHAYVLMSNHYHLLVETPEANLVAGMTWFQATYSIRFNCRHHLHGHLYQGRYKAVVVDPDQGNYFATLSDYIHLNPVRAGLLRRAEDLRDYAWSSYPLYVGTIKVRPPWLAVESVLGELGLTDGAADRRHYAGRMQARVLEERLGSPTRDEELRQLRRGWCLGGVDFPQKILRVLDGLTDARKKRIDRLPRREHDEAEAERLVRQSMGLLELTEAALHTTKKSDEHKILIGMLVRRRTAVTNAWIATRLQMGDPTRVSRYCASRSVSTTFARKLRELEKMSTCTI